MRVRCPALMLLAFSAFACASPALPTPAPLTPPPPLATASSPIHALPTASPTVATPSVTPRPTPTPPPTTLAPDVLAEVLVHQVKQVADPEHPRQTSFQSPANQIERGLQPLQRAYDVYLLDHRLVDGTDWWQVADSAFLGCCAPFGWIPSLDADGSPTIAPAPVYCPEPVGSLTTYDLIHPDGFEAPICFGKGDITIRGYLACDRPAIDAAIFLSGLRSYDQTGYECRLDDRMTVYGEAVPLTVEESPQAWHDVVDVTGHYFDPGSDACRWAPGNYAPFPIDNAPVETAQFACEMRFYATSVTPLP
jgi:hypothetical protein